jgi:hypothetical protein
MIGYCGTDCSKCDAYIATSNNDDKLREETAKLWSELNNTIISPKQINCYGCLSHGVKTIFCENLCEIRKCARKKRVENCGACSDLNKCEKIGAFLSNNPDAKKNIDDYIEKTDDKHTKTRYKGA